MAIEKTQLHKILSSLLFASQSGLKAEKIHELIEQNNATAVTREEIEAAITELEPQFKALAIDIKLTASGYRLHTQAEFAPWVTSLSQEKTPKYSRALLETLALITYKQPITRGEIEHIRGVGVSSQIMRTLMERKWVRIIGHRDVPGKPALYATTRDFLEYFDLPSLSHLPELPELQSIESVDKKVEEALAQSKSPPDSTHVH